ncbi:hypothetical protein Zmor_016604 [Zophobas morio]|uniref:C2H2-type domain-containing protein n=1 Tax=Zophobas morio TaxID=2755281 RepID=A0AA38MBW3_9CUCU|nr:hypothetical protein Zmor_016604 [Zophobas morio]
MLQRFNCQISNLEVHYCNDCNFYTELTLLFKLHLQDCHGVKKEHYQEYTIQKYSCRKCKFETHFSLKCVQHGLTCLRHLKNQKPTKTPKIIKHSKDEIIHCTECPYKTKTKALLKRHINRRHVDEKDTKKYHCSECPFATKYKSSLKTHVNVNHLDEKDVKWYECDKCPYKSKDNSALKHHTNMHHSDTWYKCKDCPYKTRTTRLLKLHRIARHLDEKDIKWYECKKCPHKTKRKDALKMHVKTRHSQEAPL